MRHAGARNPRVPVPANQSTATRPATTSDQERRQQQQRRRNRSMMEHAPPQQWPNVNVPPGYRFKPTARELIQCYLEPWVATEPGHQSLGEFYGIMAAGDVYGEDPGTLASRFQHIAHDDGNWYFLSVARYKDGAANAGNGNKQRMNRTVDGELGTWHGSGKRIAVRGVGYRQSFEFRPSDGGKTVWLMEEFGTVRTDAAGKDGIRVLCRLHLRPKAAAAAVAVAVAEGDDRQQQQVEANDDVPPAPSNKRQRQRQRQRAPAPHHFVDADNYWTAAPAGGAYSSYATTAAAPPPDVWCSTSYATTSSQAAAPVTELTAEASLATIWQHQPMMEQAAGEGGYQYHHCAAGVHGGGVYIRAADDEPRPLEMITSDVEFTAQDFKLGEDSDFAFTVENLMGDGWIMDSDSNAFSFLQPKCDGVQENNDLKLPEPSDGVQENNDGDPKGADTDAT